jgi:dinuclear metal center YbgI/SA1388 family protein
MVALTEILAELERLLEPERFDDYCPNGLQVPGRQEVATVVTGVSASAELFQRALAHGADLILVNHGLFWRGAPLALDRPAARRLRLLLEADCSLVAYHLPLDGHQELGNNALLAQALGAASWEPFADGIGVAARFPDPGITAHELIARTQAATDGREPLAFTAGPDHVQTIGIVSGAAAGYLAEAIDAGLDAFLTGEPAERVMHQAEEAGIHFVAAGHYATETLGIQALGSHLAERFGVTHRFIDLPNPI